jgi:hypothetical protein
MGAFNSLEQNIIARLGVAGSEDRLPYVVVDGPLESDGYVVTAADNTLTDLTYQVVDSSPTLNVSFGVTKVATHHAVVTLATTLGANAAAAQISSDDDTTAGKLDLSADTKGVAGNSLKVIIVAASSTLLCSMTGANTLTIRPAAGGSTVAAIATAINAIVAGKKITAAASGTTTKKITTGTIASPGAAFTGGVDSVVTDITAADLVAAFNLDADMTGFATMALYTGDAENLAIPSVNDGSANVAHSFTQTTVTNPSLTGSGVDTAGFSEAMILLTIGTISPAGALDVKIQDSADNITFDDVEGAAFTTKTDLDSNTIDTARLELDGNTVRRYIKVVSVLDPDDQTQFAEHSVVFLFGAEQYCPQNEVNVAFTI